MTGVEIYYLVIAIISFVSTVIYVFRWHKRLDIHMTIVYFLIPIACLSYFLIYRYIGTEGSVIALLFAYLGGCFLPWLMTLCIANLCHINLNKWIRIGTFLLSSIMFGFVLTIGKLPIFYKDYSYVDINGVTIMSKTYGPMHTVYYVLIFSYLVFEIGLILYAYKLKKQVSRNILLLLFIPIPISMVGFLINHFTIKFGYEVVPITYVFAQVIYLFIVHRIAIYNVTDVIIESLAESGNTGFILTDLKRRYLGSNETSRAILKELNYLIVDKQIDIELVNRWIDEFEEKQDPNQKLYYKFTDQNNEEKIYSVLVNYLYNGDKKKGYQIFLEDDTQDQKYIKLIDQYNSELEKEVELKTSRIIEMHDKLILSMAAMVESRDNSTGGHIRRTSVGVRILVEEIKKGKEFNLSDTFCRNIIKAAPMHDLGKIAVDDAILRKPGRFTPEEFNVMKSHAAEGAKIVHNILKDTDDYEFHIIAENVAHYHHERVDGTGYPDGLKGEQIPLEARIMAVADVYDALVSKRVYKEAMSFEQADEIIISGMGTQFDIALKPVYERARPKLEEYYSQEFKEDN